jgi:PTH1 family peptidyl-tRNA hydrolase
VKLVVGLGNPGPRYAESRHNVGFRVALAVAGAVGISFFDERFHGHWAEGLVGGAASVDRQEPLGVLLPGTFMNRSGEAVARALGAWPDLEPARDLLVVYDDLDLPLGRLRLRPRGGAGGHRGVADVIDRLGSKEFARLRFGIGRPLVSGEEPRAEVVDFVLDAFSEDEEALLSERIPLAAEAALAWCREGVVVAMDRYNGELRGA